MIDISPNSLDCFGSGQPGFPPAYLNSWLASPPAWVMCGSSGRWPVHVKSGLSNFVVEIVSNSVDCNGSGRPCFPPAYPNSWLVSPPVQEMCGSSGRWPVQVKSGLINFCVESGSNNVNCAGSWIISETV